MTERDYPPGRLLPTRASPEPAGSQVAQYFLLCFFLFHLERKIKMSGATEMPGKVASSSWSQECGLEPATSKITQEPIRTSDSGAVPEMTDQSPQVGPDHFCSNEPTRFSDTG